MRPRRTAKQVNFYATVEVAQPDRPHPQGGVEGGAHGLVGAPRHGGLDLGAQALGVVVERQRPEGVRGVPRPGVWSCAGEARGLYQLNR